MNKKTIILLIILVLGVIGYFLYLNHIENVKEKREMVIRMSNEYKNARNAFETAEFNTAFSIYNEILKEYPDEEWLSLEIGDMYSDINEYKKALQYYLQIKHPDKLQIGARQVNLRIGGIYEMLNDIDSAIYYYNKILESKQTLEIEQYIGYDNDRESALCRLGQIAFNQSKYFEAIDYFSKAIDIQRIPKALYIRANCYYLIGKTDLAQKDYEESIGMIRKIYINKHPYFKNILCDTCGTFFGKKEYMAVLEEWRSFDEKIKEKKQLDSLVTSRIEYRIMVDSIPKWRNEFGLLRNNSDLESISRRNALNDSLNKYSDFIMKFNIY